MSCLWIIIATIIIVLSMDNNIIISRSLLFIRFQHHFNLAQIQPNPNFPIPNPISDHFSSSSAPISVGNCKLALVQCTRIQSKSKIQSQLHNIQMCHLENCARCKKQVTSGPQLTGCITIKDPRFKIGQGAAFLATKFAPKRAKFLWPANHEAKYRWKRERGKF